MGQFGTIGIIGVASLAGRQEADEIQSGSVSREEAGKTTIQMELDENYEVPDPFANARLFRATEDMGAPDAEAAFESGLMEAQARPSA